MADDVTSNLDKPRLGTGGIGADATAALLARAEEQVQRRPLHLAALVFFAGAAAFGVIYGIKGDQFFLRLATEALIFGGLALSVDILLGLAGLLSLGQALYFGLGAYVSALVLREVAQSFWLVIGASLLTGVVAGAIGGIIAIRARGVYFALITYGLAQIVAKIIYNTREIDFPHNGGTTRIFLGASDGITGIPIITVPLGPVATQADNPVGFFFVVLVIVGLIYAGLVYLVGTPLGRALAGVRINERRMPFLGYRPERLKLAAFVLAAAVASLVGGLYPMLRGFVSPELMYFEASTNAVVATIIGGTGTLIGPLYGAVILVYVKSAVGTITHHHLMVIGALFMIAVIFFPRGLIGYLRDKMVARSRSRAGKPT